MEPNPKQPDINLVESECRRCKRIIKAKVRKQFCDSVCKSAFYYPNCFDDEVIKEKRKCHQCGRKYEPITKTQRFCDKACSHAYFFPAKATRHVQCRYCGTLFTTTRRKEFCSSSCKSPWHNKVAKNMRDYGCSLIH